jgi:NADH-quinone oxidoreductase subunit N
MLDNLVPLLPEIYIAFVAFFALIVGMFSKPETQFKHTFVICLTGLISAAGLFMFGAPVAGFASSFTYYSEFGLESLFLTHNMVILAKLLIVACGAIILMMAKPYLQTRQNAKFEFNVLFMLAILGACVAISTVNLIVMFIGLEILSFSLYILVGFMRQSSKAVKSANKYFIVGCIASSLMLYGISLIYMVSGSVSYNAIAHELAQTGFANLSFEYLMAFILILTALFFKIAIVPLQFYLPDVLYAANRPVLAFISTISKIVGLMILFHFLIVVLPETSYNETYYLIMFGFALASIFVGSVFAIKEDNINRFLAYSSINNAGFMLICATMIDYKTLMFYLINYCLIILALVSFVLSFKVRGEYIKKISDLAFIAKKSHKFALLGVFLIFALAGVPPFAMFYAKFLVIQGLVVNGFIVNAVLAVIFSIFAVAYCLRVVKFIYFNKNEEDVSIQTICSTKFLTYALALLVLIFSLNPQIVSSLF